MTVSKWSSSLQSCVLEWRCPLRGDDWAGSRLLLRLAAQWRSTVSLTANSNLFFSLFVFFFVLTSASFFSYSHRSDDGLTHTRAHTSTHPIIDLWFKKKIRFRILQLFTILPPHCYLIATPCSTAYKVMVAAHTFLSVSVKLLEKLWLSSAFCITWRLFHNVLHRPGKQHWGQCLQSERTEKSYNPFGTYTSSLHLEITASHDWQYVLYFVAISTKQGPNWCLWCAPLSFDWRMCCPLPTVFLFLAGLSGKRKSRSTCDSGAFGAKQTGCNLWLCHGRAW